MKTMKVTLRRRTLDNLYKLIELGDLYPKPISLRRDLNSGPADYKLYYGPPVSKGTNSFL